MAEPIGTLVPTQIPSLSEAADIQEAFRLYHYGAPSGTNIGEYDPSGTNPANLPPNSVAAYINTLNTKVAALESAPGIQPSQLNAKGALITATANSVVATLGVGANGSVLTANSATLTGIQWAAPAVTLDNAVGLINKVITLGGNTITGTLAEFNTALTDADFVSIAGTETLTNKTLTSPTINAPSVTGLYLSDSNIIFEGTTADDFETVVTVSNPTADRTITFPDTNGTVITTGNLSHITSTGTLSSLTVSGNLTYNMDFVVYTTTGTLVNSVNGTFVISDATSPIILYLPDNATSSFARGAQFTVFQRGTGQITFEGLNSNSVILSSPGRRLRAQYSSATIIKLTEPSATVQQWAIVGDLIA